MSYQKGERVKWDWGDGTAEGKVTETHKESITRRAAYQGPSSPSAFGKSGRSASL